MLEPARFGCPAIVGPHTRNFDDIMQMLLESDAIQVAQTSGEVIHFLCEAAHGDPRHREMASRAQWVAQDSQSVLQRYITALSLKG